MRKLLSVILVLAMVLGLAGTAFAAAPPTDVAGTTFETAVNRLAALNILKGYEDGTFKPGNNITRAEFAAVAVRALGLDAAAGQSLGNTKFKDVPATHWAAGYINIAASRGIIAGYPDGTFKPEANVTTAEAIAMLVRVCGYEPSVVGVWPTNYLSKGAEIGLTDGVSVAPDLAASRGTVALLTANALEVDIMQQTYFGQLTSYQVMVGQTLLNTRLGVTEYEDAIIMATPGYNLQGKADEVSVYYLKNKATDTWETKSFKFISGLAMDPLLGHEVTIWVKDGKIINAIDTQDASKVVTFKQSTSASWTAADKIINSKGTSDTYDDSTYFLSLDQGVYDGKFFWNRAEDTYNTAKVRGSYLTLILNDSNKVRFIIANRWEPSLVVTKVTTGSTPSIQYYNTTPTSKQTLALTGKTVYVTDVDGNVKTLADIPAGAIIEVANNAAGEVLVRYTTKTVTGTVSKVVDMGYGYDNWQDWKVYIGDTGYALSSGTNNTPATVATTVMLDDTGKIGTLVDTNDESQQFVGYTGTFYLDPAGKIRLAAGTAMSSPTNRGFIIGTTGSETFLGSTADGYLDMVKVLKVDGTTSTMPIDPDATNTGLLNAGAFVELTLNSKGYITDVSLMTALTTDTNEPGGTFAAATDINKDYDRITVGGKTFTITSDTKIFDNTAVAAGQYKAVAMTWGDFEETTGTIQDITVWADTTYPTRAKYVVINDNTGATLGNATSLGVVLAEKWVSGTERFLKVLVDGVEKTYEYTGATAGFNAWFVGSIATLNFDSDGNVSSIDQTDYEMIPVVVGQIDPIGKTIDVGGFVYYFTEDSFVYDWRSDLVGATFDTITEGQYIDIYYVTGSEDQIAYVVIETDAKYARLENVTGTADAATYTVTVDGVDYVGTSGTWIYDAGNDMASVAWGDAETAINGGAEIDVYLNTQRGDQIQMIVIRP
ncbi:MAG: S-layer homology domain-containing protein [Chloroflexota bacterium]